MVDEGGVEAFASVFGGEFVFGEGWVRGGEEEGGGECGGEGYGGEEFGGLEVEWEVGVWILVSFVGGGW